VPWLSGSAAHFPFWCVYESYCVISLILSTIVSSICVYLILFLFILFFCLFCSYIACLSIALFLKVFLCRWCCVDLMTICSYFALSCSVEFAYDYFWHTYAAKDYFFACFCRLTSLCSTSSA